MTLVGYDEKKKKFTKEALQKQTREVLAVKRKITVRYPKKGK